MIIPMFLRDRKGFPAPTSPQQLHYLTKGGGKPNNMQTEITSNVKWFVIYLKKNNRDICISCYGTLVIM